jgi:hypothetical protein
MCTNAPAHDTDADQEPAVGEETVLFDPPHAHFATGYMGDEAAWCYWDAEYPDEGSCGPFATREEAVLHAATLGYFEDTPRREFANRKAMR